MRILFLFFILFLGCSPSISKYDNTTIQDTAGCTYPEDSNPPSNATGSFGDGLWQYQSRNYQGAIDIFQYLANRTGDARTRLNACMHIGYSFRMLGDWEKSACAFLRAEKIWKAGYMQGGDADNSAHSTGILSRIYSELTRNFSRLDQPVIAAVFAWAALRDKTINDPSITVTKTAHHPAFLQGIDQQTFALFFDRLHPFPGMGKVRYFRVATETDRQFLEFHKRHQLNIRVYMQPKFSGEMKDVSGDDWARRNLYQVYYRGQAITGYIYHTEKAGAREKYTFKNGRLVSSLVELSTYATRELRLRYDDKGRLRMLILITEMMQQPFYKFLPEFVVYKFK